MAGPLSAPGRNAPCPCGSGKKYKKCCLAKQTAKQEAPPTSHDLHLQLADSLRKKILKFAAKSRYSRHVDDAFDLYWQTLEADLDPPEMDERGYAAFLEWFIHDYPIPGKELPVIKLFLQSRPALTADEMQVLQDWQDSFISVYQVKAVEPGRGALVEDIFTGQDFFLNDVSLSKITRKWELVTLRKVQVLDEWQASSVAGREPPEEREGIYSFVMEVFRLSLCLDPNLSLPVFLRESGYILQQRLLTLKANPLPSRVTPSSREEMCFYEADYDLADLAEAAARLKAQEDFAESGREEDGAGEVSDIIFEWREKRRTLRNIKKEPPSGVKVDASLIPGRGQGVRILGNVRLEPGRLILETSSAKYLSRGKKRLEQVLTGLLRHREDAVKTLEEMLEEYGDAPEEPGEEIPPEVKQTLLKEFLDEHYRCWLDTPFQELYGKTPRQAVRTGKGRQRVEAMLREMEYEHLAVGDYDTAWVRKELGLNRLF